jgi:hypothetical protein
VASGGDNYRKGLRNSVYGLWAGVLDKSDFQNAMSSTIERWLTVAWNEGAAECGISPEELTVEEHRALLNAIDSELGHLSGYADYIIQNSKANGGKRDTVFKRLEGWVRRYQDLTNRAKTMACKDKKLEWSLGATEDHCRICNKLHGKVKRASYWEAAGLHPQDPPNDRLDCGGWNCLCELRLTDKPISKGPLPGARGPVAEPPSIPKPMEDIDTYLAERRRELEQNNSLIDAILEAHPELDAEQALFYADVMTLKKENFYKYAEKLGLSNIDELADQAFNRELFIKREIAKQRWELQAQNTYKPSEQLAEFYDSIDEAPLIGRDSKEAMRILEDRFGVRVVFDGEVDPDRVHKEISRLLAVADERPAVYNAMQDHLKTIRYKIKPQREGHTAVADYEKDLLNIWTSNHDLLGSATLTHEMGHAAEEYVGVGTISKVFDRGQRVSMYGWGNHSEDFAEVFAYYLSGEDAAAIAEYVPEKIEFMRKHIPGFE